MTGLSRMQVLQSAGSLKKAGIVRQTQKGGDTAYVQIESFQHLKPQILSVLQSPSKLKEIATKRTPALIAPIALTRPAKKPLLKRSPTGKPTNAKSRTRIALLVTNPERRASLQTGIEARDIQRAIEGSVNWDSFDLRVVLEPTFGDLVDSLNRFNPDILHFSGHGGGSSLLLGNERAGQDGGEVLDFEMAARLLDVTAPNVSLIVLAACDTVEGAECLLKPGRAIIAMSDSIDDEAACAFSERLYKSIVDGVSVTNSLAQAKLFLEQKGYEDALLPTLIFSNAQDASRVYRKSPR